MKTNIAFAIALLGLTISVSGQAPNVVDFRNLGVTFLTEADRLVYRNYVGGLKLVGTNYVAGLWFAPGTDPSLVDGRISPDRGVQAGVNCGFRIPTTATPGAWLVPITADRRFPLEGVSPGGATMLQVRVWDRVRFPSFAEAFAAGEYGASTPFPYTVPLPGSPSESYYMDNLRAFSLTSQGRTLVINDLIIAEGSNGVVQANFAISLTVPQTNAVSVDYATSDGTALAGEDYVATNGTVTFAPGEVSKVISVAVTADGPPEDDEYFYLNLSNPVFGVLERSQVSCLITEVRIAGLSVDTAVSFNTVPGRRYVLERTNGTLGWETVPGAEEILGTGGIISFVDVGSGCQTSRQYRARLLTD